MNRRVVLRGLGGVTLALPFLEGLAPRKARAQATEVDPYCIFLRQGNGVATAQDTNELGQEPERFWPLDLGPLDAANMSDRAISTLVDYADKLLVVRNVNMENFSYGDGHARGALQCLTGRGPVVEEAGGNSEAAGESLDHRIGRQVNPEGQESLFFYAGSAGGWLGGPCISYRSNNTRRSALHNPWNAYEALFGSGAKLEGEAAEELAARGRSVNDLVRGQLQGLLNRKDLSKRDRERLDLHLSSIRDFESGLACYLSDAEEATIEGYGELFESNDGDDIWRIARAHMDIAALSVACGMTRSVAIQIGNGNDGSSRYRDPDTGEQMENYHYISHRRFDHGSEGEIIANSDLMHHKVDVQFGQAFKYLLDRLSSYEFGDQTLLDFGTSVWLNDLGNGPGHSARNVPYVIAGSAGGYLRQGQYIELDGGEGDSVNHARVLNTLATAAGCTSDGKDYCDDLGDEGLDRTPHPELLA